MLCRPEANRDPTQEELDACLPLLFLFEYWDAAKIVLAVGRIAARQLLGAHTPVLDAINGNAYRLPGTDKVIIPTYHPAAGLRNQKYFGLFLDGVREFGRWARGERDLDEALTLHGGNGAEGKSAKQYFVVSFEKEIEAKEAIQEAACRNGQEALLAAWHQSPFSCLAQLEDAELSLPSASGPVVPYFVDTETWSDGIPYSIQISRLRGKAGVIYADDAVMVLYAKTILEHPKTLTVFHNAKFDLAVLNLLGIIPTKYTDTMSMAYLLQNVPIGLKPLAMRLCNAKMRSFGSLLAPYQISKAQSYLQRIADSGKQFGKP